MADYTPLWAKLGPDLEAHARLFEEMGPTYYAVYLTQENRTRGMKYFNFAVHEIHGLRVQELERFQRAGGRVMGTFYIYVPEELILATSAVHVGLCAGIDADAAEAAPTAEKLCTGPRYFESLTKEEGGTLEEVLVGVTRRHLDSDGTGFTPSRRRCEKLLAMVEK